MEIRIDVFVFHGMDQTSLSGMELDCLVVIYLGTRRYSWPKE